MPNQQPFNAPRVLVDPQGKPARKSTDKACPRCGASPDKRRLSGGFGEVHDVCGQCGEDFLGERTAEQ
jgi:uncharacterized protein (DUF983 family)